MRTVNATGRKYNAQDNTVPGYALMFALFGVTAGAGAILEEKETGTFKRLLIAPLPPYALLGGKLLAQFIQSLVQLTVLFALGALLFKIDLGTSLPALALLIVGTSFAATGLGMILVSFIKSQRQLRPVTTLVVLSLLGARRLVVADLHRAAVDADVSKVTRERLGHGGLQRPDDLRQEFRRCCRTSGRCSSTV